MDERLVFQIIAALCFILVTWRLIVKHSRDKPVLRSVAILVLGDVGRSPRMMYHAESFAKNDYETFLIGYRGSKPTASLRSLPHIRFLYLSQPPKAVSKLPFVLGAPIKIIHQISTVLAALMVRINHPPEFIMVQNPPSIPTLALVWLVGWLRGSKVIIDWHNLGYSILALKLGPTHLFVRIYKKFESTFGRKAYAHLFVTDAMREHLVREWDLQGHKAVLHDRPPVHFRRSSPQEVHELFLRLKKSNSYPALTPFFPPYTAPYSTPFTTTTSSSTSPSPSSSDTPFSSERTQSPNSLSYSSIQPPRLRDDRPALLVSSTSWTPDEDFSILLSALSLYDKRAREANKGAVTVFPKVLMIVTGKGPLKNKYMKEVEKLQEGWEWVRCVSMWLESEDYPVLLGSADLGISLHSSSSQLDLPMKVVDMFGCGLPVCALDFTCLHELVKDGVNGLVFTNAQQLSEQIATLLTSFPSSKALSALRTSLIESSEAPADSAPEVKRSMSGGGGEGENWEWNSWDENWDRVVRPLVSRDANGYRNI